MMLDMHGETAPEHGQSAGSGVVSHGGGGDKWMGPRMATGGLKERSKCTEMGITKGKHHLTPSWCPCFEGATF